jgi:translation initiation factor 2-alpha kinase 4
MNEAIKSMTSTSNYPRLVFSLFSRPTDNHKDYSYDFNSNTTYESMYTLISTQLQAHAYKVFERHGAVKLSAPLFMPKNDFIYDPESTKKPVQLMDTSGDIVQVCFLLKKNILFFCS